MTAKTTSQPQLQHVLLAVDKKCCHAASPWHFLFSLKIAKFGLLCHGNFMEIANPTSIGVQKKCTLKSNNQHLPIIQAHIFKKFYSIK